MRASAHSAHAGRRAWQVRRPWRSRLTCSSSSSPGGVSASISSCSSSNGAPSRSSASRAADARDVRVDRDVVQAVGEQQHARGRLAPDARQRDEVVARLGERHARQPVQRELDRPGPAGRRVIARRIAWMRADLTFEMPPGRIASSTSATRRVADRSQVGKRLAQPQVGDVAVAVVGRLREHGQDRARRSGARAGPSAARRRPRAGGRGCGARAPAPGALQARRVGGGAWRGRHAEHRTGCLPVRVFLPRGRGLEQQGEIAIPSTLGGPIPVFWRSAPATGGGATPLYLHGVPTSSDDWVPFLERTGGIAPDLPGFGRSGKPGYLELHDGGVRPLPRALPRRARARAREPRRARLGRRRPADSRSGCPSASSGS